MTDERPNIDELVTIDEQIKIVKHARSLISEPGSWVQGSWTCQLVTPYGEVAKTPNGSPRYQYCVEGAMNQATYDIIGEKRALALGAVKFNEETGLLDFQGNGESQDGFDPTALMGIDALAKDEGFASALEMNDSGPETYEEDDEDHQKFFVDLHKNVVGLLTAKLEELTYRKENAA
jgi:hypothetical protein